MQSLMNAHSLQLFIKITGTVVSALVLIGICVLLILLLLRLIQVKNLREHTILIRNQGNVTSTYQIAVEAREPLLRFKLLMNGTPLVELPADIPPAPSKGEKTVLGKQKPGAKAAPAQGSGAGQQAERAGKAAAQTAGNAAGLFGALGSMIPGSAGSALKEQGANMRSVQTKTMDAVEAPEDAKRRAEAIQKSGQRLGLNTPSGARRETVDQAAFAEPDTGNGHHSPTSGFILNPDPRSLRAVSIPGLAYCVQSPELAPGEGLALTLQISPHRRRFSEGSYPYMLISQQIPVEPLNREASPVSKQALVHLQPVETWRYILRYLASATVVTAALIAFGFIFTLIWK
jgi:hypothetical protein